MAGMRLTLVRCTTIFLLFTLSNCASLKLNCGGPYLSWNGFRGDTGKYTAANRQKFTKASSNLYSVYKSHAFTKVGNLFYKLPVPAGTYSVSLLFAETFLKNPGARVFTVKINGKMINGNYKGKKITGAVDIVGLAGADKPLLIKIPGVTSVNNAISIEFVRGKENPMVSGIVIDGPNADKLIGEEGKNGGGSTGGGNGGTGGGSPPPNGGPGHTAHSVPGGPYVITDFDENGRQKVTINGQGSHSHGQNGNPKIVKYKWVWKDPSNPAANKQGFVTNTNPKGIFEAAFPLGKTTLTLTVTDENGDVATDKTTVEVRKSTKKGAYCYYYDYGSQNPSSVPLQKFLSSSPKPAYAKEVSSINFGSLASFGNFKFKGNSFAVRCVFFVKVGKGGPASYSIVHSGPIKVYINGAVLKSSDSKKSNTLSKTPTKVFKAGLQPWQIHYFRPKGAAAKLQLKVNPAAVQYDSSAVMPVITGLSFSSSARSGGGNIQIFGAGFFNGVKVTFGGKVAKDLKVINMRNVQVTVPSGKGNVKVVVSTKAGVSNAVLFKYVKGNVVTNQPIKFIATTLKSPGGGVYKIPKIASVTYGPDGRLYLGNFDSKLYALTVSKNLIVTKTCVKTIATGFRRSVLGLAFNPNMSGMKLYFTTCTPHWTQQGISNKVEGWQNGKVQSVTITPNGCFNNDVKDVVTGLPVSDYDHGVNKLTFLPNGQMLIGIGGSTNGGIPHKLIGNIPESPLSAAIVSCPASGTTNIKYSNPANPGAAKVISGGCKVYAPGFRNTFGMWYHTNKKLYATDNGPNRAFGSFATNCQGGELPGANLKDRLHLVVPGKCHGHPNFNRGQCKFHDPNCVKPIAEVTSSTTGVIEYRSNTFGGKLKGNLFLSMFADFESGRLSRVILSPSGKIASNGLQPEFFGGSGLDIAEGPYGELVMPQFRKHQIFVAKPSYKPSTGTFLLSVLPRQGPPNGGTTVLVTGHNFGKKPTATFGGKACKVTKVIDSGAFVCSTPPGPANTLVKVIVKGASGTSPSFGGDYWYY